MAVIMDKFWYVSPIKVTLVRADGENTFVLQSGSLVSGVLHEGDTKATATIQVMSVEDWGVYGNVELPVSRFKKFDKEHAYLEE